MFKKCLILASLEKCDVLACWALISTWSPPAGGSWAAAAPWMGHVLANSLPSHLARASPFCYLPGPRGNWSLWLQIIATNVQAFIYVFLNNTSTHELSIISQDRRMEGWHDLLRYQRANSCPSGIWIPAPLAPGPMCAPPCCPAFQWAYDPRRRQPSHR